jgi:hypothetical protein
LRWFEVHVDDATVYRSASRKRRWQVETLRNRHVRPMVESVVTGGDEKFTEGFCRWMVALARKDFPDAGRIELVAYESTFPEGPNNRVRSVSASAPAWPLVVE